MARVTRRFVPLAFICYVVAYLDRVNVGFVAGELQRDLGLSATTYGLAAGLFFLGYCLFEVPSNIILERVGARRWIARIMITWGLVAMATAAVRGAGTFMLARVLLGVAEAGFFPGMVLFFTWWFPASERARTGALFMAASPIAVIVGAPLSTWILRFDGVAGLRGWQWLFLAEGLPAVVLGAVVLLMLTDRPEEAGWLAPAEREWLVKTLLRQYSSEYVGVTLDTGNNLSILDDPEDTVEQLAPWTFNTHFKDMAVEETEDGFLMSEVPLGEGLLDLPRMVAAIRAARPDVYFSLEMITRDPLRVPCLTEKYWSTFTDIPGTDLARLLRRMRANRPTRPLPRIGGLSEEQRYALEVELVERSIAYATLNLGL